MRDSARFWQAAGLLFGLAIGAVNTASAQTVTACCGSEIKAFESEDAKFPPPASAVEIVGSSTIRLWDSVRNDLAPLEVIPRGFGGSSADDLDYYLDRIVLRYAPRAVAIYEGDTDTGNGKTAAYVAAKLQQITGRIRTALPATRVYIISVKPSPYRWAYWPIARDLNQMMRDYCSSTLECTYIDTASALLDANGQLVPSLYAADRVHLSPAGYAIWSNVVRQALMAGEGDDIVVPSLQSADTGFAPTRGAFASSDGYVDVSGSGVGLHDRLLDGFRYQYRELTGNGQITVRVAPPQDAGGTATPLAGVMIRETLTPESRHAFVYATPGTGVGFTYRSAVGTVPSVIEAPQATSGEPRWLRLVRKSNLVTGYVSANGKTWQQVGSFSMASLKWKLFIGVAVTAAAEGTLVTSTFDNLWIQGATVRPAALAVDIYPPYRPKNPVALAIASDQVSLSWENGGDKGGAGVAGYRVYRNGVMVGVTRTPSFVDTGLSASTTYSYNVDAFDKAAPTNSGLPTLTAVTVKTLDAPVVTP